MGTAPWLRLTSVLLASTLSFSATATRSFAIHDDAFYLDGSPMQIMSGEFHYSRCPEALWRDRLERMAAMGLNAVATYVPWNWHNPSKGVFDFHSSGRNLTKFVAIAQDVGLLVLMRAGPFMCGEWEFGGLPSYLINETSVYRTMDTVYISYVDQWWGEELLPRLAPQLYARGGPIVMVQIENEYGSFGDVSTNPNDKLYMEHLVDLAHEAFGDSVQLYTTDGGSEGFMIRGTLNGSVVYSVGDHGPGDDTSNCAAMAKFNPPGANPCMDSEYYTGWLTHWGETMANTSTSSVAQYLDQILASGSSFNLYMAYGGTNVGFYAGANGGGSDYQPHITSYDYDSPISEGGEHGWGPDGDKYTAIRQILAKYANHSIPDEPLLPPRAALPPLAMSRAAALFDNIGSLELGGTNVGVELDGSATVNVEALGQDFGLAIYRTVAPAVEAGATLRFDTYPRDRATVFVDGVAQGVVYRPEVAPLPFVNGTQGGETLDIMVDIMGRLNYGADFFDPKGCVGNVTLGDSVLADGSVEGDPWRVFRLPLSPASLDTMAWKDDVAGVAESTDGPVFYRSELTLTEDQVKDCYVNTTGWGKGMVWVNDENLGRYWEYLGPSHSLWLPSPFLRAGSNIFTILELEPNGAPSQPTLTFSDHADFSGAPAATCDHDGPVAGETLQMFECWAMNQADRQSWTLTSSGTLQLSAASSLCLSVGPDSDPTYGFPLAELALCDETDKTQIFTFDESTGWLQTVADAGSSSSLCLDVSNHDTSEGAKVGFYACTDDSENQEWSKAVNTDGASFQLAVKETGFCLTGC